MSSIISHGLRAMLKSAYGALLEGEVEESSMASSARQFIPEKRLCERDYVIIDMLNSEGHEDISYCVCDAEVSDMPIVFSSDGFCKVTGYSYEEIEGRNCRFLQGPDTNKADVQRIRRAIKYHSEICVNLLNYRKDGSKFVNEFFMAPLRDDQKKVVYFVGVQCPVSKLGPGQMPANAGWIYTQGMHA